MIHAARLIFSVFSLLVGLVGLVDAGPSSIAPPIEQSPSRDIQPVPIVRVVLIFRSASGSPSSVVLFVCSAPSSRSAWFNQYAYCGGDPVNRSDPSGLDWVWSDGDSAWKWVANATDPNKGELQDIPIPEWAVPGFNWTHGPKTISTEHALVTRLAPHDDMRSPAILAMAQLVGSGIAGWSTQGGKWDQETHEILLSYFKENKISSGTAGIETYNKRADSERARVEALVEAQRRKGAQFDEAKFREGMYKVAKIGLGMVPVIAALDATVKAQGGDYKGAAKSAVGLLPIEKLIITVGTVAVVGATIVLTAKPIRRAWDRGGNALESLRGIPWGKCVPTGCEDIAKRIQGAIGGQVHRIAPGKSLPGTPELGARGGTHTGWYHHEVVVRDGKVYDAMTGPEGLPINEFKKLWEHADVIDFGF